MDVLRADPSPPVSSWRTYHQATRSATYGFLMALPLLVLYEALILAVNQGQVMQVRISAEVWIKQLLPGFGTPAWHLLAVVVVLVGAGVFFWDRRNKVPVRPRYFGWMVLESAVYAVMLAVLVSSVVGMIFAAARTAPESVPAAVAQMAEGGLWTKLALSIGAGLYEELLFRVLLVGGLYLGLKALFPETRVYAYVIAAVVGAVLFSAVHYVGALGDPFTLSSFTFRFLFGLALNVVFLLRGFGVAAWTHALYDVMVVTGLL